VPQEEDVFWWTVGGDRDVLKPGRKVAFAVSKQTKGFVFCTLPDLGGIEACPRPCLSIRSSRPVMQDWQLSSSFACDMLSGLQRFFASC